MTPAVRARLKGIEIRCPARGCLLTTVFWMPRRPTAEELQHSRHLASLRVASGQQPDPPSQPGHYLYVGRTASGTEVYDILNYGYYPRPEDDSRGCSCCRILYWRAGCRHGTATIDRGYIYDLFSLSSRVSGPLRSEEQSIAELPAHLRRFWGKRVFHPDPKAWHPKMQTGSGRVAASNTRTRTRAAKGM
jgi:hypothetical protein